jgi:hypothetical protein
MAVPQRREDTICIRSSLLEDATAGPGHSTVLWASQRRVLPVPGGARPKMCGAVSRGTRRPRPVIGQPTTERSYGCTVFVGTHVSSLGPLDGLHLHENACSLPIGDRPRADVPHDVRA